MRVTDPDGRTWRVGRRWLPWRRRLRSLPGPGLNLDIPDGDDPVTTVVGLVVLAIGLAIMLPFVVVLLGVVLELAALTALLPLVVGFRLALGRPWTVQVVDPDRRPVRSERVTGWRASGERMRALAEQIRDGRLGAADRLGGDISS